MKGFIEVDTYDKATCNKSSCKMIFPIERIAVSQKHIIFEGVKYGYYHTYEEIKQLIKEATEL